jgi:hypothetical protein
MAVARCELGVAEIDWVVAMCEAQGRVPEPPPMTEKERARIMRELKRAQRAAHESLAREQAHTRKMKAGFRTAPGKDTEVLDTGQVHR